MLCIAAFIVFAVLGIFSARYRGLARQAWGCVFRRLTLKPCDTAMGEDLKNRLVGKFIVTRPYVARFINRFASVLAFLFVVLSLWSVLVVAKSGLNLFVYGTCSYDNPESCSIASGGCGITSGRLDFLTLLVHGRPDAWVREEAVQFFTTMRRIPNRLKTWNASDYTVTTSTYYHPIDNRKSTALEVIDPSCQYCAQLFENIEVANMADRYNLTYLLYPIADAAEPSGYKFPHSWLLASYLEAVKMLPVPDGQPPADWQLLRWLLTTRRDDGMTYQEFFNSTADTVVVEARLQQWLADQGYSQTTQTEIAESADSSVIRERLAEQRMVVEQRIQTIRIPTLIFGGKRYEGVVAPAHLQIETP